MFELCLLKQDTMSFQFMLLYYQALGKAVVLNFWRITGISEKLSKARHFLQKENVLMDIQSIVRSLEVYNLQVKRPPKRDSHVIPPLFQVRTAGSLKLLLIHIILNICFSVQRKSLNHSI